MLRIRFARFAVLILCLAGVQPVGPCTRDASAEPESATREADVLNSERLLEDLRAQLETRTPHSTRSTEDAVSADRLRSGDSSPVTVNETLVTTCAIPETRRHDRRSRTRWVFGRDNRRLVPRDADS